MGKADPAHKKPAGSGGDIDGRVQATNVIYCCRPCHDFHELDPEAREQLQASKASCAAGGFVAWTRPVWDRLLHYKRTGNWKHSNRQNRPSPK